MAPALVRASSSDWQWSPTHQCVILVPLTSPTNISAKDSCSRNGKWLPKSCNKVCISQHRGQARTKKDVLSSTWPERPTAAKLPNFSNEPKTKGKVAQQTERPPLPPTAPRLVFLWQVGAVCDLVPAEGSVEHGLQAGHQPLLEARALEKVSRQQPILQHCCLPADIRCLR